MDVLPFIDPRLRIDWDERVGYGVFAKENIKSGEFLEMSPVIVVDNMPEDDNLAKYVVAWEGKFAFPLGWTMMYNHSDRNSCEMATNFQERLFAIIAIRDIEAEEQITVNYGSNWFSSRGMEKVNL